ncbi:MAG TPA: hypothetical protein PKJ94_07975 [Ferruginibacter sp.]|nr:hypothetical protein [Ferruginibacter sp.]
MKHKPFRVIILLMGLAFFFSCGNSSSPGDFSVNSPQGWTREDTLSDDGSKRAEFTAPFDEGYSGFIENISVSIIHTSISIARYSKALVNEVKELTVFYEEKGKGDELINGTKMKWIQMQVLFKSSKNDEKKEQKIYFAKGKGNIYMIVCTAKKDGIALMQNEIREVVNSFRIIND